MRVKVGVRLGVEVSVRVRVRVRVGVSPHPRRDLATEVGGRYKKI